jgi:hypothetical protein
MCWEKGRGTPGTPWTGEESVLPALAVPGLPTPPHFLPEKCKGVEDHDTLDGRLEGGGGRPLIPSGVHHFREEGDQAANTLGFS